MAKRSAAHAAHLAVAGVSGLSVTLLEFAAVRFMAPSFGQSNYVWANVIGVILLALALGYWFGGRLADRSLTGRPLYAAYVVAALYVVGIAYLGSGLCEWLVPREVGSSQLLPLAFTGSLAATVLLFGPPTLVLGMTSPFLIRLDEEKGKTGTVAGRIFAVGTLGSLVGCYLGPLWLFQAVGSRATILLCAAALAALGFTGLALSWRRAPLTAVVGGATGGVVLLLALGLAGWTSATGVPLRVHDGQLAEVESAYQTIRVAEELSMAPVPGELPLYEDSTEILARFLRYDEDVWTYQSIWLPDDTESLLTGGRYYEHLALGAWIHGIAPEGRLRVLVVGYAGGSVHRVLRLTKPPGIQLEILGVEIDPAVFDVARTWLAGDDLEGEELELIGGEDARTVVNALPLDREFDLVIIDAYIRTTYVPFQVASVEFFTLLGRHLAPGGWISVNLHSGGGVTSRLVTSFASTMASAEGLGDVYLVPNPLYPGSLVLWQGHEPRGVPRLRSDVDSEPRLRTPAFAFERLLIRHDPVRDGGQLLTDDKSDIDRLTDEDIYE